MATELELKFTTDGSPLPPRDALTAALAARGITVAGVAVEHVKDRYFDDARASLSRAGLALRRRMRDGRMLATLKSRGAVAGSRHLREEIELPLPERGWPPEIEARISMVTDVGALKPYTVLDSERTVFRLADATGTTRALLSFDLVTARFQHGDLKVEFLEIEVEAAGEDATAAADLFLQEAASTLETLVPLVPSPFTKLERAQALLLGAD